MVPGSGFLKWMSAETFASFRDSRFGLRVQHVLNDRSQEENFRSLNEQFHPHVVVFNNREWTPGTFTDFVGNAFHYLIGACDSGMFTPAPSPRTPDGKWVIGAQLRKNSGALISALRLLPERFVLRLFGPGPDLKDDCRDLIEAGRIESCGALLDEHLAAYYHTLDCFVSPETNAGWSNAVAEAMASGVPVICTAHGTAEFARDGENALLLSTIEPQEIADKIRQLDQSSELRQKLTEVARVTISKYDWKSYARGLEALFHSGREKHYLHAPGLGMHGKWLTETRLQGLEGVLRLAPGRTVLDLGAAEGWIAYSMLKAGATLVHGLELEGDRVRAMRKLCHSYPESRFDVADLSDWPATLERHRDWLRSSYDIVLYLGIHHHLPASSRMETLSAVAALATRCLSIRTAEELFEKDDLAGVLAQQGFRLIETQRGDTEQRLGALWLFERNPSVSPPKPI
jgi:2-polyprenyl-3-methyl-5-hydroxy-6-metoxy-1,4-benzoquinol methylase